MEGRCSRVRVVVAGGTDRCGSCTIPELITARRAVTALARSDKAAAAVFSVEVHRDVVQNLEGLKAAADSDRADDHLMSGLRLAPPRETRSGEAGVDCTSPAPHQVADGRPRRPLPSR